MNNDFHAFLSNLIDPVYARAWISSQIEKVEVYRNERVLRIFVKVVQPLSLATLINTAEQLRNTLEFSDTIEIIPLNDNTAQNLGEILNIHKDELSSSFFSDLTKSNTVQWRINEDRLDLIASDQNAYNCIIENEICTKISNWFWEEYCLRIVVRVLCKMVDSGQSVEDNYVIQKPIEVIEITDNSINKKKRRVSRKEKKENQSLCSLEVMKISELEEGLRNAVIEGEIWNREATVLKDGRYVVTYFVTDYTDTIILKSFMDNIEDDSINTGDWIRANGSIRYDNFAREIVMFLDSYLHIEKSVRRDESAEKRVELHAHTKMSAMDGLTEIKNLIDRAVEWGHRAIAITDHGCVQAFPIAYAAAQKHDIKIIYGVEGYLVENDKKEKPYHIILLARNLIGLKNLYKLVSLSYLDYFYRHAKMPRDQISKYREGIFLGTACEAGELYRAILREADEAEIESIVNFYDYLEIQPIANNSFMLRNGMVESEEKLKDINRYIVELGKKYNKPVVATGDVHFLEPYNDVYRAIIQAGQGYDDVEEKVPLYFHTTEEMLNEFAFLGEKDARRVVIECPAQITEQIEKIQPVPDGFYPPKIDSAEEEIIELTWERAHKIYGDKLPVVVEERINRELGAITKHGFSVLYLIAHKLVKKSNEDGYLVGSRGSVGSSVVAFFTGITEVNALKPHYVCPECQYSDFSEFTGVGCGADLKDKNCPQCGTIMNKYGFDIPFETFLGFEGDKVPDIDLNFSGDYQSRAHHYVEELFGTENVFRAGTISTVAEKTAFGFVKNYAEKFELDLKNSEMARLAKGITGVRRTTGQHPGGMIVVPHDHDILEFTPLQHPADNKESGVITTHFEYHAIGDQLVKLDILGHDDPTVIKELEDLTGVKASLISLSDKKTMSLFSSAEALGVTEEDIGSCVGTFGIPEFGTRFVRQMLEATRPTTFVELVRISGLSHGTDVWLNNAQTLIENGTATLNEVICTRDDIMIYLIEKGMEKRQAFKIMEKVRKGKGLNNEEVSLMEQNNVPSWYIESCQKIKYMFPKAHAVAYVTMAFRIAYFKVNYPREFYASFFSIRAEDFDADTILQGYDAVKKRIVDIDKMGYSASQKDKKLVPILELAAEMYARGFKFYPVDIYRSEAQKFLVYNEGLLLPFSALPNVGVSAAEGIVESRSEGEFISVEEFQQRTHLNKTAMEMLRLNNCFAGLPETTQISLFG